MSREVRQKQNEWAVDQLNRWASVLNDGALYHPGPADMSAAQEVQCRITLEDMAAFDLVDSQLRAVAKEEGSTLLKDLLIHVHWKGEPLEGFRPLQPGQETPAWMRNLGIVPRDVCKQAYRDFVKRMIRGGGMLWKMSQNTLSEARIDKYLLETGTLDLV